VNGLDKVLVDTSVWIEFFRKNEPYHATVARLIDAEQICLTGIIVAELIQGAKTDKELSILLNFPQVFPLLPDTPQLWLEAGRLAYSLRRKGVTVGLADCFIAATAAGAKVPVATLDTHFELLKKTAKVRLYKFPA